MFNIVILKLFCFVFFILIFEGNKIIVLKGFFNCEIEVLLFFKLIEIELLFMLIKFLLVLLNVIDFCINLFLLVGCGMICVVWFFV